MKTKYKVSVFGAIAFCENIGNCTTKRGALIMAKKWAISNCVSTHWLNVHMTPTDGTEPVSMMYGDDNQ
jgi:hypothetical protein